MCSRERSHYRANHGYLCNRQQAALFDSFCRVVVKANATGAMARYPNNETARKLRFQSNYCNSIRLDQTLATSSHRHSCRRPAPLRRSSGENCHNHIAGTLAARHRSESQPPRSFHHCVFYSRRSASDEDSFRREQGSFRQRLRKHLQKIAGKKISLETRDFLRGLPPQRGCSIDLFTTVGPAIPMPPISSLASYIPRFSIQPSYVRFGSAGVQISSRNRFRVLTTYGSS